MCGHVKKIIQKKHFVYFLWQILDLFLESLMNENQLYEQTHGKSSSVSDIIQVHSETESYKPY